MSYMKSEFDNIISQYGHKVYLRRRLVDDNVTEGDKRFSDTFEIHKVRHMAPSGSLPDVGQEQPEGLLFTTDRVYYFRSEAVPFEGDWIYETPDPRVKQTIWEIEGVIPMRGLGGDIDYWMTGATRIRPN